MPLVNRVALEAPRGEIILLRRVLFALGVLLQRAERSPGVVRPRPVVRLAVQHVNVAGSGVGDDERVEVAARVADEFRKRRGFMHLRPVSLRVGAERFDLRFKTLDVLAEGGVLKGLALNFVALGFAVLLRFEPVGLDFFEVELQFFDLFLLRAAVLLRPLPVGARLLEVAFDLFNLPALGLAVVFRLPPAQRHFGQVTHEILFGLAGGAAGRLAF